MSNTEITTLFHKKLILPAEDEEGIPKGWGTKSWSAIHKEYCHEIPALRLRKPQMTVGVTVENAKEQMECYLPTL